MQAGKGRKDSRKHHTLSKVYGSVAAGQFEFDRRGQIAAIRASL